MCKGHAEHWNGRKNDCREFSIPQNQIKLLNSPVGAKSWRISVADSLGNRTNTSTAFRDVQSIGTDVKTAENSSRNIRKWKMRSKMRNSPIRLEIKTATHPGCWKRVGIDWNDVYIILNVLIESLDPRIRRIVFGQNVEALRADKKLAASVEDEMADSRDGE